MRKIRSFGNGFKKEIVEAMVSGLVSVVELKATI